MLNKLLLVGRRADENEAKETKNGEAILYFTVACQRNFKNKESGEYQTDFISLVAFGKKAEYISRYLKKGKLASIEANIRNNNYIDKDGTKVFQNKIVVENLNVLQFSKEDDETATEDFTEEIDYSLDEDEFVE